MKKILIIILCAFSINGYTQFCHANFGFYTDYAGNAYFQNYSYSEHINDSIVGHIWLFGDGTSSYSSDPMHHYFASGDYNVCHIIETSLGCIDTICWIVTITDYCNLEINTTISEISIYGGTDGEISLDVNLGMPPYNYNWSTGDTTSIIDSLPPGVYSVTVCDGLNCCDSVTINLSDPPDTLIYAIYGTVYAGNNLLPKGISLLFEIIDSSKVKAFKYGYIENGEYSLYPNKMGEYYIYAIPYAGINYPYTPVYFPTYYGDTLFWENAQVYNYNSTKTNADIHLNSNETFLWGNAGIFGTVQYIYPTSYETNIYNWDWFGYFNNNTKISSARNIPIILFKNHITPLLFTLSDENGNFSFPNLEYGTYQIYAEKAGFLAEFGEITLDSLNPLEGIDFIIGNKQIILGKEEMDNNLINNEILVYPNPAVDYIAVENHYKKGQHGKIQILNSSGQTKMIITNYRSHQKINISHLASGMYYLNFCIDNKSYSTPIIIN